MKKQSLILAASLIAAAAQAQPVRCSPGFQDSSCGSVLINPAQTAPTCSTEAGWATTSAAVWQGSHYSTPGCSYTAAPTCPANYTMTVAPGWNGSAWSSPTCAPNTPPAPTDPQIPTTPQTRTIPIHDPYEGMENANGGIYGAVAGYETVTWAPATNSLCVKLKAKDGCLIGYDGSGGYSGWDTFYSTSSYEYFNENSNLSYYVQIYTSSGALSYKAAPAWNVSYATFLSWSLVRMFSLETGQEGWTVTGGS